MALMIVAGFKCYSGLTTQMMWTAHSYLNAEDCVQNEWQLFRSEIFLIWCEFSKFTFFLFVYSILYCHHIGSVQTINCFQQLKILSYTVCSCHYKSVTYEILTFTLFFLILIPHMCLYILYCYERTWQLLSTTSQQSRILACKIDHFIIIIIISYLSIYFLSSKCCLCHAV